MEGNFEVLVALIEHGADPNIQNFKGETALVLGASNENAQIVDFVLNHGAVINQATLEGVTGMKKHCLF